MSSTKDRRYFLVQVSEPGSKNILGRGKYHYGELGVKNKKDSDALKVRVGDRFVVYFAGNAIDFQRQLKSVYQVTELDTENRDWHLDLLKNLRSIPLAEIREKTEKGELGGVFTNCGRQGFNLALIGIEEYDKVLVIAEQEPAVSVTVGSEELLEDYMVNNWRPGQWFGSRFDHIEILKDPAGNVVGQQYDTREVGIVDLLCQDKQSRDYVVIEVKRGNRTSDQAAGQLSRYVSWVREHLAHGKKATGIIVCAGHDKNLEYAVRNLKDCFVAHYDVRFSIKLGTR